MIKALLQKKKRKRSTTNTNCGYGQIDHDELLDEVKQACTKQRRYYPGETPAGTCIVEQGGPAKRRGFVTQKQN